MRGTPERQTTGRHGPDRSASWSRIGVVATVLVGLGLGSAGACATGAGGGSAGSSARSAGGDSLGRPAPDIVVERLNGQSLALSSLRGKVVLLDVWASWCVPCKKELPMLDAIARRLGGRGVEVLAVSIDQKRANLVKFLDSQPRWSLTIAHDPRGAIADTLQPEKMPTSYVIDRVGVIRYVNGGFDPADAPIIERRLAELADDGSGSVGGDGSDDGRGGGKSRHGRK